MESRYPEMSRISPYGGASPIRPLRVIKGTWGRSRFVPGTAPGAALALHTLGRTLLSGQSNGPIQRIYTRLEIDPLSRFVQK